jgi:hypothetical protein
LLSINFWKKKSRVTKKKPVWLEHPGRYRG